MKIRTGFVSNSSSASFIVEVEGKHEDVLQSLYANTECFSPEGCIKLIKKDISFTQKYKKPKDDAKDWEKKSHKEDIKRLRKLIKDIKKQTNETWQDYLPSWKEYREKNKDNKKRKSSIELTDERLEKFCRNTVKENQVKAVKEAMKALHWYLSLIDDGFLSINVGGPICHNGWEDIAIRKELLEIIGFFTFYKYNIRTRIESHEGSF